MFTGIVEQACSVHEVVERPGARRIVLDLAPLRQQTAGLGGGAWGLSAEAARAAVEAGLEQAGREAAAQAAAEGAAAGTEPETGPLAALGDSVAVNGVCLTVAALAGDRAAFDVITETLERTNLGGLAAGDAVNVERAMRLGDRIDGHLVQGHIEGTGRVRRVEQQPGQTWVEIECGPEFAARTLFKGSVCIDGVSLTVTELGADHLAVALVPHTLERTILGRRAVGDVVNLEADMIGAWVRRTLEAMDLAPRGAS